MQGNTRGRNSVVECQLPKLDVAGSSPVARSFFGMTPALSRRLFFGEPMPRSRTEPFLLTGYDDNCTTGVATVTTFDRAERIRRAVKGLTVAWGAALVSIFIPVAHFLLVPGFALAGVFVFAKRTRAGDVTESIHGTCPHCGHEQDFDSSSHWHLPMHLTCANCSRLLTASAKSTC